MPGADRNDDGKYTETYATERFLDAITNHDGLAGTSDIADAVGCSYETAYKKLRKLADEGVVNGEKVANARVWTIANEDAARAKRGEENQ